MAVLEGLEIHGTSVSICVGQVGTGITPYKAQPTYRNENDLYAKH